METDLSSIQSHVLAEISNLKERVARLEEARQTTRAKVETELTKAIAALREMSLRAEQKQLTDQRKE